MQCKMSSLIESLYLSQKTEACDGKHVINNMANNWRIWWREELSTPSESVRSKWLSSSSKCNSRHASWYVSYKIPLTVRKYWKDVGSGTLTNNKRKKKHSRCFGWAIYNRPNVFPINMPSYPWTGMPRFRESHFFDCLFHVKNRGTSVYFNVFANWPKIPGRLHSSKNSVSVVLGQLIFVVEQPLQWKKYAVHFEGARPNVQQQGPPFVYGKTSNEPNCLINANVSAHLITCYFVVIIYILNSKYSHIVALMNVFVNVFDRLHQTAELNVYVCFVGFALQWRIRNNPSIVNVNRSTVWHAQLIWLASIVCVSLYRFAA